MKLREIIIVALAAAAFIAATPRLEAVGISEDLAAALVLTTAIAGLALHRRLILRKHLDWADLLLVTPALLVLMLVILKDTDVLPVPSIVIWIVCVVLFVLAAGYTAPPEDGEMSAP